MGRKSNKERSYVSVKGKTKGMGIMDLYYKSEEVWDILQIISNRHRKWGNEWYELLKHHSYESAKTILIVRGKGEDLVTALEKIDELMDIENAMIEKE